MDLHSDWIGFQHKGVNFAFALAVDDTQDFPWNREDGHGPVIHLPDIDKKRPGERALGDARRNGEGYVYDFAAAVKLAQQDRWGMDAETCKRLNAETWTARQVAAWAADQDFKRLDDFMRDQWFYVGILVAFCDDDGSPLTDETESVWGVESDCSDYHRELAGELADELLTKLKAKAI